VFDDPDLHHDKLWVTRRRNVRAVIGMRLLSRYGSVIVVVGRFLVHGGLKIEGRNFLKNRVKRNRWSQPSI